MCALPRWLLVWGFIAALFTQTTQATPLNDSYLYTDEFGDNTGIDLTSTGFINLGGAQTAKSRTNELISQCFHLPQAIGGNFTGWSFAEFSIDNLDQVRHNNLVIETCDSSNTFLTVSPPVGTTAYDLSSAIPATNTHIRFRWTLEYHGNGGARTAAISTWRALGTATGGSLLTVTPSATSTNSNADLTFTLGLTSTGVTTKNPILEVDLNAINGTPDIGVAGIGLATDATVCYDTNEDGTAGVPGTECKRYRPLEFLSASNGSSGEPPDLTGLSQPLQTPATNGPTDGIIRWQLQDLSDSYSGSISVNLHIPKGYIDGKTLALSATLNHGETSADGTQNNFQSVTAASPVITVSSQHNTRISAWSPFGNLGPGAQNIQTTYFIRNHANQNNNPSDHENITIQLYTPASASCVPQYRNNTTSTRYNWPFTVDPPAAGAALDTNPVTVNFYRTSYVNDSTNARVRINYDIPNDCSDGTVASTRVQTLTATPPVANTPTRSHNIVFNACRGGYNHMHRLQSGLLVENNYLPNPGWNEYYINNGSVRPGEYISTWSPYGNSTYRTHTINLEKSYALINIPDATTFHGYRNRSKEDADSAVYFFKDPDGTAPEPTDAGFNNDFNPATQTPAPGWFRVQRSWTSPFTNYTGTTADNNDPAAVVGPNSRLLAVKTNDNTSFGPSDNGLFRAQAVWRVCDGSYGCAQSPDNTPVKVTGNTFSYQQTQAPFSRACSAMNGYTAFVRSVSYPQANTRAIQQNVQAGDIARLILSPHNSNMASQYVDGRWSFDLSAIAASIDLDNVTGEVLTGGLNLPKANQNIPGQSCSVSDIVFVAPTAANPVAWWDIPARCQIPNGWGVRVTNNTAQDNIVPAYQLQLNVPIKPTTLANTVLNFAGQIRTTDLSMVGADNAVTTTRWPASNYESIAAVTVLENPSVSSSKSAPSGWPIDSTFSYSMTIDNQGNAQLDGYYLLDQLPRTGVYGSEFDPVYGSVFINAPLGEVIVERSEDPQCNADSFNSSWTNEPLTATSRTGFQSQTAILPQTTLCIRVRRAPAGQGIAPQQSLNLALDIRIPDDLFLSGKNLFNKAAVGVTDTFGGNANISTAETALVTTTVDGAVVLGATKSTSASIDKPGQIGWWLGFHNASGTEALSVTVSDTLAPDLTYQGLMQPLPAGVSCTHGYTGDINGDGIDDCAIINTAADGSGGTLEFLVAQLTPDDGNPAAGTDQGVVGIWTTTDTATPVQNCVFSIPPGGVSGTSCSDGQLSPINLIKTQQVDTGRTGNIPPVYFGETVRYTLSVQNTGATARYLRVQDKLPEQVSFVPGTLTIDGASASDNLFSNDIFSYTSVLTLAPGSQTTIEFSTVLDSNSGGPLVSNNATSMLCSSRNDDDTCLGARQSNTVQAEIRGSKIRGQVFNDNGRGNGIAHNGSQESVEESIANIQVSLFNATSNQLIYTTTTDSNGAFNLLSPVTPGDNYQIQLTVPGQWLAVSHHKGNTQAIETSPATNTLSFQATSVTTAIENVRFGLVQAADLISDQTIVSQPAATVAIPHTLTIASPGMLTFDLAAARAVSTLDGWQVDLLHDVDCNQNQDSGDVAIVSAINADPDNAAQICLLLLVHTPNSLAQSLTLHVPLEAIIELEDSANTGHAVTTTTSVLDSIEVIVATDGHLALSKLVRNVTRNQALTQINLATPGDTLNYQLNFQVNGTGTISEVFINDSTPPFSSLSQPVSCPTSLGDCIVIIPASAQNTIGYSGQIKWKIADSLPAGTNGSVSFEVMVE